MDDQGRHSLPRPDADARGEGRSSPRRAPTGQQGSRPDARSPIAADACDRARRWIASRIAAVALLSRVVDLSPGADVLPADLRRRRAGGQRVDRGRRAVAHRARRCSTFGTRRLARVAAGVRDVVALVARAVRPWFAFRAAARAFDDAMRGMSADTGARRRARNRSSSPICFAAFRCGHAQDRRSASRSRSRPASPL